MQITSLYKVDMRSSNRLNSHQTTSIRHRYLMQDNNRSLQRLDCHRSFYTLFEGLGLCSCGQSGIISAKDNLRAAIESRRCICWCSSSSTSSLRRCAFSSAHSSKPWVSDDCWKSKPTDEEKLNNSIINENFLISCSRGFSLNCEWPLTFRFCL